MLYKIISSVMIAGGTALMGVIAEKTNTARLTELGYVISFFEDVCARIRSKGASLTEAFELCTKNGEIGRAVEIALEKTKCDASVSPVSALLAEIDNIKAGILDSYVIQSLKNLCSALGKNDTEYQICLLCELTEKLRIDFSAMEADIKKNRGIYIKSALCAGIMLAVFFF